MSSSISSSNKATAASGFNSEAAAASLNSAATAASGFNSEAAAASLNGAATTETYSSISAAPTPNNEYVVDPTIKNLVDEILKTIIEMNSLPDIKNVLQFKVSVPHNGEGYIILKMSELIFRKKLDFVYKFCVTNKYAPTYLMLCELVKSANDESDRCLARELLEYFPKVLWSGDEINAMAK